jgi:hypothetical protein
MSPLFKNLFVILPRKSGLFQIWFSILDIVNGVWARFGTKLT